MAITAKMVSELRKMTGAAMMQCKKALEASDGDMDGAVDNLRKAGLKSAAKKASRETAEGRVFEVVADGAQRGHLIGVSCETDFLSGADKFKDLVSKLGAGVSGYDPDGVGAGDRPMASQPFEGEENVDAGLKTAIAQFGENVQISDLARMENVEGRIGTYIHHDNKQGAIVSVTTGADADKAQAALRSLCQHVVVFCPAYAQRDEVPSDEVERERAVIAESDEVKSKPENIRGKIIDGKMGRFYSTCVLSEQPWILDDKTTVGKFLEGELGAGTRIEKFTRIKLG
jgi:elongation factor Ts